MDFYLSHRMLVDFSLLAVISVVIIMAFLGPRISKAEGNAPRVLVILVSFAIAGVLVISFENTMFFYWLFYIISN